MPATINTFMGEGEQMQLSKQEIVKFSVRWLYTSKLK
jgi:hypothetical protein